MGRPAKITNENIDTIVKLYQNGVSATDIATQFGCVASVVLKNLRKHGVVIDNHRNYQKEYFSTEIKNKILSLYKQQKPVKAIAKELKYSFNAVKKVIINSGVEVKTKQEMIQTNIDNKIKDIIEDYKLGLTLSQLAKKYKFSSFSIKNALLRANVKINNMQFKKQCVVDETFFDSIDTEQKAYWLGMIVTDGCVSKQNNQKTLIISLKGSDKKHLLKFNRDIKSTFTVTERTVKTAKSKIPRPYCRLAIYSAKLFDALGKYGVVPNKTGSCYKSELIPEHLERHFWRGAIDGDGSVYGHTREKDFKVDFLGDRNLALSFTSFCKKNNVSFSIRKSHSQTDLYQIKTCGYQSFINLVTALYENANVYLDRKFERYELFTGKLDWLL